MRRSKFATKLTVQEKKKKKRTQVGRNILGVHVHVVIKPDHLAFVFCLHKENILFVGTHGWNSGVLMASQ